MFNSFINNISIKDFENNSNFQGQIPEEIYHSETIFSAKRCEIMENKIIFENKKEKMKKKEKKYYLKQKLLI